MTEITSSLIKDLREKTGAGMMDCKKALVEVAGDIEAAVDWLRKKGLASAAKKAGRTAAEGLIAVAVSGNKGAMIELNAETDFVARNEQFQQLAKDTVQAALTAGSNDVETIKNTEVNGAKIGDTITSAVATIGENMNLRRGVTLSVDKGIVCSYIHNAVTTGLGKIGVLVALKSEGNVEKLLEVGKQIAMHIAAARPEALTRDGVDSSKLDRERDVLKEQAAASGKPAEVIDKMVEGRIRKYYEEVVLLDQLFVIDGKTRISDFVEASAKDVGAPVELVAYERYQLGEGIEKESSDFAAEVAAAAGAAA